MQQMWTPWRMAYIRREKRPGCIFCEMLEAEDDRGQLILHRSKRAFLVLNKYPYNNGHLMAVPYRHVDTLEALTVEEATDMMAEVALGIRALRRASSVSTWRYGTAIRWPLLYGYLFSTRNARSLRCRISWTESSPASNISQKMQPGRFSRRMYAIRQGVHICCIARSFVRGAGRSAYSVLRSP